MQFRGTGSCGAGLDHGQHLARAQRLKNISSIAFGGPDRRTAYLGNLLDDRIYRFDSPVAGAELVHWHF